MSVLLLRDVPESYLKSVLTVRVDAGYRDFKVTWRFSGSYPKFLRLGTRGEKRYSKSSRSHPVNNVKGPLTLTTLCLDDQLSERSETSFKNFYCGQEETLR